MLNNMYECQQRSHPDEENVIKTILQREKENSER